MFTTELPWRFIDLCSCMQYYWAVFMVVNAEFQVVPERSVLIMVLNPAESQYENKSGSAS